MTAWNDGYVSDIAYEGGVYREQMPAHLDAACLTVGIAPPVPPGAPFTYCELGCGVGDTAMIVAAANARAQVWGFDFNPAHIARGRALAARAGLGNLTFAERSFEDLAHAPVGDLSPFDYVTLHGVWAWVSQANQAHIVTFLRRNLRPGGLVSVSYNAMPGWSQTVGLQHLLYEAGRGAGGTSDRRFGEALALVQRVQAVGGSSLDEATVARVEKARAKGHLSYLSHEYLNEHWRPCFFAEVAGALAPAKLSFVASANILENFPGVCMKPEQRAFVEALPPELRQTVKDYYCPRSFRRDIFVRGPRAMTPRERAGRLGAQRLALAVPASAATCEIEIPVGKATLNPAFYRPALDALGRGAATVGDLLAAAAPGTAPVPEEVLGMLVGGRQVLPVAADPDPAAVAQARRFNRARISVCMEEEQSQTWLAGARVGAGIQISLIDMLVYEVVAGGEGPAEEAGEGPAPARDPEAVAAGVRALLAARGMSVTSGASGEVPDLEAEIRGILAEAVPVWERIGAL